MKLKAGLLGEKEKMIKDVHFFMPDERCRFRPMKSKGIRIVARLTMQCDMACPHCLSSKKEHSRELNTEQWLSLIRQFKSIGTAKVLLTGGEPLMRHDLVLIVEALSSAGILSDLNSNLQRMTLSLMQDLKRVGLSEISVSLEGPEKVHDLMHGYPGAFNQLLKAISWAEKAGIGVDASCCLANENIGTVMELIRVVNSLPIRSLTFSRLLPIGHGHFSGKYVSSQRLSELYDYIKDELFPCSTIPLRATGLLGAPKPSDCERGNTLLGIASDGRLLGCVLSEDNPIIPPPLEIGLAPALQALRQELSSQKYSFCWVEKE